MNRVQQVSNYTKYDRYPKIMKEVEHIVGVKDPKYNPLRILSFGCSIGEEVKTLNNIYFKKHFIDGYDIREDIINKLKLQNKERNINYYSDYKKLNRYDIIFCMSVLCVWPETIKKYSATDFNRVLKDIDNLLKKDGFLIIYNSKFILPQSTIGKKYQPIATNCKDSGYMTKYDMNTGEKLEKYPYFIFKKISE